MLNYAVAGADNAFVITYILCQHAAKMPQMSLRSVRE